MAASSEPLTETAPYRGKIDRVESNVVAGWAMLESAPETPITLEIFQAGDKLGEIRADRYRADLEQAGFPGGRFGFQFQAPASVTLDAEQLAIRFKDTETFLAHSKPGRVQEATLAKRLDHIDQALKHLQTSTEQRLPSASEWRSYTEEIRQLRETVTELEGFCTVRLPAILREWSREDMVELVQTELLRRQRRLWHGVLLMLGLQGLIFLILVL